MPVIDTLGLRCRVDEVASSGMLRDLQGCAVGNVLASGVVVGDDGETRPTSWQADVPVLGRVHVSAQGEVYMMRSLSLVRQDLDGVEERNQSNGRLLGGREASRTLQDWMACAADRMPMLRRGEWDCRRADVVYDRPVVSSMVVLKALEGAIKPTRGGCAWYDNRQGQPTGLMLRGRKVVHRVYDKALESMDDRYRGMLRSEEQLRAGSKGLERIIDMDAKEFDREACVDVLNERYLECGVAEGIEVEDLVKAGSWAQACLVLNPELLPLYRETVRRSAYYEMRRKIMCRRAEAVPVDLRVPADAYVEAA